MLRVKRKWFKIFRIVLPVDMVLVSWYEVESWRIQCEPCLPGTDCPPCETWYMAHFIQILFIWNGGFYLYAILLTKIHLYRENKEVKERMKKKRNRFA